MPTVTKPKRPIDTKITPVKIAPKQRRNLCESAGHPPGSRAGKDFLARVSSRITWHANMIRRVPQRSLPAHTIAALKPIAKQAADLAQMVNSADLPIEVIAELGYEVITGAHLTLTKVAYEAERAIQHLADQSRSGQVGRELKEARRQALNDLETLYRDFASDECDDDDRAEFLTTCRKLLRGNG